MKLNGRTAIITGASQGLGSAIAEQFVREGCNVVVTARNEAGIQKAAAELKEKAASHQSITAFAGDASDRNRMEAIINAAIEEHAKIDILVNNAGVYGPIGPLEEADLTEWRNAFDVNFYGSLIPMKLLLGHFKKNNFGRIINLSGGGATKGMPSFSCYASAKAAIVRLTETIALEAVGFDITVNAIAPGALNTRLLAEVLKAGPERTGEQFYRASLKQEESGGSSLENAAALCVFLASDEGRSISGRLISAVWDDWKNLHKRSEILNSTDIYMLRRITAKERGQDWDGSI